MAVRILIGSLMLHLWIELQASWVCLRLTIGLESLDVLVVLRASLLMSTLGIARNLQLPPLTSVGGCYGARSQARDGSPPK